ncbi:hypothetical protein [Silvibacterium acidisoli]|uniref:hypothetical protein n=1 Tax=Acidobacteriaceae bacterium ZG23-2 TaxID=2883246 RepID=UPI00406C6607
MNTNLKALASLVLLSAMSVGHAQTTATSTKPSTKKKTVARKHVPAKPSVQSQIEELRNGLNSQKGEIDTLRQQLADRDAQLQQAQQAAAAAQSAANQAQQAAQSQQQTLADNSQAVSNLQGAVGDLKTNTQSLVTTIQDQQAQVKKDIEHPDAVHFKGITISPTGSFLAAETVWRNRATGGDINTSFTGIPLENSDAARMTEFFGSGRQSRIALLAEGKTSAFTMRGYYEADWLGVGVTSNNNQSNSYVMRQRQLWAQAETQSGWTFTGGQMWSLATETKQGMTNRTENLPMTIDPQYEAGFVWARQYGFRVTKNFANKFWFGVSAENAQTLAPSCAASTGGSCPTNYFIGSAGTNGGLYNGGGAPGATSSGNLASYSFNLAPDMIAKVVAEPGWGHYEVFGIARFFRNRIYPNDSGATPSSAGAYNDKTVGGGIGGSLRVPTFHKHLDVGLKGLWGDGIGRYGSSTLPDLTLRPDAQLALLHGFSGLSTLEYHATPRLDIYANYGGDYVGRYVFTSGTGTEGYGSPLLSNTGCGKEPVPGTAPTSGFAPANPSSCAAVNKDVQEYTLGYWYDFYKGPAGRLRQGIQYSYFDRNTWSGVGGAPKGTDAIIETSFRYYLP